MAESLKIEDLDRDLSGEVVSLDDLDKELGMPASPDGSSPDSPINEQHPDLAWYNRLGVNTLATGDEQSSANWLQNLGFEVAKKGTGFYDFAIRKPGGSWYRIEPRGMGVGGVGEVAKDIGDLGGELTAMSRTAAGWKGGAALGAKAGGALAGPIGAGVGTLAGGLLGAAGAGALVESAFHGLGQLIYGKTTTPIVEIAKRGAIKGAAGEAIGRGVAKGVGAVGRGVLRTVAGKGAKAVAREGGEEAAEEIAKALVTKTGKEAAEEFATKGANPMWGKDVSGHTLETTLGAIAKRSGARSALRAGEELVEATPEAVLEVLKKAPRTQVSTEVKDAVEATVEYVSQKRGLGKETILETAKGLIHGEQDVDKAAAALMRKAKFDSAEKALQYVNEMSPERFDALKRGIAAETFDAAKQLSSRFDEVAPKQLRREIADYLAQYPHPPIAGTGAPHPLESGALKFFEWEPITRKNRQAVARDPSERFRRAVRQKLVHGLCGLSVAAVVEIR